jgi:branched-chain amino acid transport system substrate-binding protein
VKSVNAAGGINGHPVKVTLLDDGGSPTRSLAEAKQLIQQDHVQAIVGETSNNDGTWASYVASQGVPVIGGIPEEAPFLSNPDFYASGASVPVTLVGETTYAKSVGKNGFGILYCAELPICAQTGPLGKLAAGIAGMQFSSGSVAATAPNYTAPCLAMKGANTDALEVADNAAIVLRVVDSCATQGYKPTLATEAATAAPNWLSDSNVNGALIVNPDAPYTDMSNPAVAQFRTTVDKYYPGTSSNAEFSYGALYPWVGLQLFKAVANGASLTPTSNSAAIKKGMYGLHNETLNGLAPPLNYTPGKPAFINCYSISRIDNGSYQLVNGGKMSCLSAAQTATLGKGLAG